MKLSLLLSGAIALVLVAAPVLPAFSQTPSMTPKMEKWGRQLDLSTEQRAKMQQIRESAQAQIQAILTDEQKARWQAIKQQGRQMRQEMAGLNLTNEQKATIRTIRQTAKQQMEAVLTPEQRQKMNERQQQMRQRRQQQPGI